MKDDKIRQTIKTVAETYNDNIRSNRFKRHLSLTPLREKHGRAASDIFTKTPRFASPGRKQMLRVFEAMRFDTDLFAAVETAELLAVSGQALMFVNFGKIVAHGRFEDDLKALKFTDGISESPLFAFLFWHDPDAILCFEKSEPATKAGYYFYTLKSITTHENQNQCETDGAGDGGAVESDRQEPNSSHP